MNQADGPEQGAAGAAQIVLGFCVIGELNAPAGRDGAASAAYQRARDARTSAPLGWWTPGRLGRELARGVALLAARAAIGLPLGCAERLSREVPMQPDQLSSNSILNLGYRLLGVDRSSLGGSHMVLGIRQLSFSSCDSRSRAR
jgi:hypothetical protein